MDSPPVNAQGRLLDRFRQPRVAVADAGDVFGRGAQLYGDGDLLDQIPGLGADDVAAEHRVGRGVGEDLDEAVGVGVAAVW